MEEHFALVRQRIHRVQVLSLIPAQLSHQGEGIAHTLQHIPVGHTRCRKTSAQGRRTAESLLFRNASILHAKTHRRKRGESTREVDRAGLQGGLLEHEDDQHNGTLRQMTHGIGVDNARLDVLVEHC